ncbi:MAG: DUF962 domain-containing protein [Kangiellaceae bacterium]|nr:DUF962 domain-containing protein [Kangiellaceae bacterium]
MKTAEDQLSTYKSVHLSKKNVMTHFFGVPLIIWSILVLLNLIQLPIELPIINLPMTVAAVFFAIVLVYYFLLHWVLALTASLLLTPLLYSAMLVSASEYAIWIAIVVFVVGWLIQFLGHHYEKAKPAFVDDLNQLSIGPFFLIAELVFMLGGLKKLESTITEMAIEKRRIFERGQ